MKIDPNVLRRVRRSVEITTADPLPRVGPEFNTFDKAAGELYNFVGSKGSTYQAQAKELWKLYGRTFEVYYDDNHLPPAETVTIRDLPTAHEVWLSFPKDKRTPYTGRPMRYPICEFHNKVEYEVGLTTQAKLNLAQAELKEVQQRHAELLEMHYKRIQALATQLKEEEAIEAARAAQQAQPAPVPVVIQAQPVPPTQFWDSNDDV